MEPTTPEKTEASTQEPVAPEQAAPSVTIPKERLDQEIAKRKALEVELAKYAKEVETLKSAPTPQKPDSSQTKGDDISELKATVMEIRDREQRRDLQLSLKLSSQDQAKAVQDILKASPDLKPAEALQIAQMRTPDAFGGTDQRGFNPSQHASLRPSGGGPQPVVTLKDKVKAVREIQDPIQRGKAELNLHGKLLADALGWQYPN